MTRDEFERNKHRFGDDFDVWPAPFRQEALAFVAGDTDRSPQDDPELDRLVLEAALMDSDEQALARKVLARIDAGQARLSFLPGFLLAPAGLVACAAAFLVAATLAGYQLARLQDDLQDSELLALASGARLSDNGLSGDGESGIAADPAAGEDSL
ncbi:MULTISPECIES: hypothetical protein [unclassified Mesorhizobium]|uniref:hypothetical protein n=1 Tax=unclassified Mesorhizobium TaxID=325217 RepID=UPI000F74CF62|nr:MULTISPECIES: hypothetical protein [unclassified Mesorhizobium]AZO67275.1 hypothetical protein EJ075_21710 [Mesorhizobium sp. M6A.T.Cr.TU.016.01.1.1]RWP49085.1 MAG: hypothetical protein EOR06_25705 [Mesorhizobium sp.]RWQ77448.1 MAG: hypothetical protein EOS85_19050 [Mesorhizobium sp.]